MATVAIVLKTTKKLSNDEYAVALRVTHERVSKYFTLSGLITDQTCKFRCTVDNWRAPMPEDNGLGRFMRNVSGYKELNKVLETKLLLAQRILKSYEDGQVCFDFDRFESDLRGGREKHKHLSQRVVLQDYYQNIIQDLEGQQKVGLASVYKDTASQLGKYSPKALLVDVNVRFLERFESYLRVERKNKDTTISVKMRNIQRVINLAIEDGIFKRENYPFGEKRYSVNKRLNHKTNKRAISLELISKIKNLCLDTESSQSFARDIFFFSFYTRGMNFADIAALTWDNIVNNEIHYVRKKTGQPFYIPINDHTAEILNYYRKAHRSSDDYIFPIFNNRIHVTAKQKYTRTKSALKKVNYNLKLLAKMIGEEDLKLTTYVSRHSYATSLKRAGVATSIISEALGHQTEEQTQTYLDDFEKGVISNMESRIFDF